MMWSPTNTIEWIIQELLATWPTNTDCAEVVSVLNWLCMTYMKCGCGTLSAQAAQTSALLTLLPLTLV